MIEQEMKELLRNNLNERFVSDFFKNHKLDEYILEKPYPNAKYMVVADDIEDKEYLADIFNFLYERLPFPKKKK